MKIPMNIARKIVPLRNFYRSHSMVAMGIGAVGIGTALYDSNYLGKRCAKKSKKNANANAGLEYFNNTQYLDNKSHLTSKIKKSLFKCELGNTLRGTCAGIGGYVSGLFGGLFSNTVPLALSTGALLLKGKKAMASAGGLVLYGLISSCRHVTSHLNKDL